MAPFSFQPCLQDETSRVVLHPGKQILSEVVGGRFAAQRHRPAHARRVEVEQPVDARFAGRAPLMANMVEGGKTPILPADELQALGYDLVIFPGGLMRALATTAGEYFASLRHHGTTQPFQNRMLDFEGINALLGTDGMLADGQRYDADAHR